MITIAAVTFPVQLQDMVFQHPSAKNRADASLEHVDINLNMKQAQAPSHELFFFVDWKFSLATDNPLTKVLDYVHAVTYRGSWKVAKVTAIQFIKCKERKIPKSSNSLQTSLQHACGIYITDH